MEYLASAGIGAMEPWFHLRIATLIDSRVLLCWRGLCRSGCQDWKLNDAQALDDALEMEFALASQTERIASMQFSNKQRADMLITVSWFRR